MATMKRNTETLDIKKLLLVGVIAAAGTLGLSACEDKGPLEKAGESMDQTMDDAGDAYNEGVEEVKDEVDDHTTSN